MRDKTITDQTFEQRSQAARNAEASVANAEAAVRQAELDLQFTELRAPVNGRIGDRRVSPGNLVTGGTGGNTTLLATIVSTDPIHFEFTFDEASFLRYERMAQNGHDHDIASRGAGVAVVLKLIDEKDFTHNGRMDFVDNVIDRSTGTIRGRALFANPDGIFTPGMFARVRVPARPPTTRCWCPTSPSAPSRRANTCWWSTATTSRAEIRHARAAGRRAARDQERHRHGRHASSSTAWRVCAPARR